MISSQLLLLIINSDLKVWKEIKKEKQFLD